MNLREVEDILLKYRRGIEWLNNDETSAPKEGESIPHAEALRQLAHLFKRWALEMVGEDYPGETTKDMEFGYNQANKEIRQRILDSIGGE